MNDANKCHDFSEINSFTDKSNRTEIIAKTHSVRDNRIFEYSIKGHISMDKDIKERQLLEKRTLYKNILFGDSESKNTSFARVFVIYYIIELYKIGINLHRNK